VLTCLVGVSASSNNAFVPLFRKTYIILADISDILKFVRLSYLACATLRGSISLFNSHNEWLIRKRNSTKLGRRHNFK
jgi:hypothetical protein